MNKSTVFFAALIAFTPLTAFAYVGPGMGLSAIAAFFALMTAVFVTLFSFIWLPLKRLLNSRKKEVDEKPADQDTENTNTKEKENAHD